MNILLTNDDGYSAYGINVLKKLLSKYGRVVICAPLEHMSAKGCSITLNRSLHLTKIDEDVYAVDGTPADATSFGLTSLGIKFDLVVSGINHGLNISFDVNYSGTIGACLEALTHKVKTFAVSCDNNFEIVEKYFDSVYQYIIDNNMLNTEYLLNINFPLGENVKSIEKTSLYYRNDPSYYIKNGNEYMVTRNFNDDVNAPIGTDCYCYRNGIVSITLLGKTFFKSE